MAKRREVTSEEKLNKAVRLLKEAVDPEKIILFGSRATGDAKEDSDYDIMVIVKDKAKSTSKENIRLLDVVGPLCLGIDVLLVSKERFDYWKDTISTVYYDAQLEGQVLYEKAA